MLINNTALKENQNLISEIEDFFVRQYDYFDGMDIRYISV